VSLYIQNRNIDRTRHPRHAPIIMLSGPGRTNRNSIVTVSGSIDPQSCEELALKMMKRGVYTVMYSKSPYRLMAPTPLRAREAKLGPALLNQRHPSLRRDPASRKRYRVAGNHEADAAFNRELHFALVFFSFT